MSKGQASLIEHVMTIFLGVIVMISLVALVYSFYINAIKTEVRESLRQIALYTSENIIKIYNHAKLAKVQPSNQTSTLITEIDLNLPADVSKRNYEVYLVSSSSLWTVIRNFTVGNQNISFSVEDSGAKIVARTTQDPIVTVEQNIPNIDIDVQGISINGKDAKLRYYSYNINGTAYNLIVLGEPDILAQITSSI